MIRAFVVLLAALAAAPAARGQAVVVDLSDRRIEIATGFTGAEVLLFGVRDGAADVVVALRGPTVPVAVRRKSRRLGVWLNTAQLVVDRAPGYYAVASNRPLAEIAPAALFAEHRIGLENALPRPESGFVSAREGAFLEALARVMKARGLYRESPDGVSFIDGRLFRGAFALPADVPTGRYLADVLLVSDGALAGRRTVELTVRKTGFGAAVFDFAQERPLAYGLAAAAAALAAGWAAGAVFRRR